MKISYPEDAAGEEFPQLMNVLFGLTCQHAEVQLVDFQVITCGLPWSAIMAFWDSRLPSSVMMMMTMMTMMMTMICADVAACAMCRQWQLTPNMSKWLPGPRFGIEGLREKVGVPVGPILCTALKPMGRSVAELADMAYAFAKGGGRHHQGTSTLPHPSGR